MFKTQSRKGLSLAAIVALGASLLIGSPAQAAGEVNLETKSGVSYEALAGTTFQLTTNVGSLVPSSAYGQLKVKVTNTGATTYSATMVMNAGAATSSGDVSGTTSGAVLAVTTASDTNSGAVISLSTANSESGAVLTVQAWLDADLDGVIDTSEFVSEARVVTFHKVSAITWTTALTAPVLSASAQTLSAVVSTNKGINMAQLAAGSVKVAFATVSGTAYTALGAASHSAGAFNNGETASAVTGATDTAKATLANITVEPANTYVAVAIVNGVEAGSEVYAVAAAATVTNIDTPELTDDNNVKVASGADKVRPGTAIAVEYTAAVSKSAGVAAAAGKLVTVTVAENSLTSVSAIVGGGKTLSNASSTKSEEISFTVAVDADGLVTIPLAVTMKDGESFTIKLSADNVATSAVTLSAEAVSEQAPVDLNDTVKIVKGSTATLKWAVLDQFGAPISGDYRFYLTGGVTASAALVNGAASFDVAPTATTTYTAQLQKYNTSTLVYANVSGISDTHDVTVGTIAAAGAVTLTASSASNLVLNGYALKAVDTRLGATAPKLTTGNRATLSGQVTDANGVATYGVVKLSAPNVMFKVGSVYSLGSADVTTDATGAYSDVVVYSNTAGKVTVSATIGSATKDLGLSFVAAADTAGAKWVITAPTNVVPGSTAQFKAQLLDTWSNPVKVTTTSKISVTYTGPGFVTAALPTTTDADGMLSFSVLYGSADTGNVTVKFAYDGDADSTTATDNVATSVTATVGAAPAAASTAKVNVGTFNGFIAVYAKGYNGSTLAWKIAGKWFKTTVAKDFAVYQRKTAAIGLDVKVDIYVDGVKELSKTVTTK